jgi:hypothetical protein
MPDWLVLKNSWLQEMMPMNNPFIRNDIPKPNIADSITPDRLVFAILSP